MYLLDTNVISELRRPEKAAPAVLAWAGTQVQEAFFLSAMTVFELELGVQKKERSDPAQGAVLRSWLTQVTTEFEGRIATIDPAIAVLAATYAARLQLPVADALIAATARMRGYTMVTRNVKHFQAAELEVLNPWQGEDEGAG